MRRWFTGHAGSQEDMPGFDFKLHKINIGKLVDFIPSLDTIVPMLRSFQGMVNFEAAAETSLDSNLNVRIPTLRSAVHIKGDSLVLMDAETLRNLEDASLQEQGNAMCSTVFQ